MLNAQAVEFAKAEGIAIYARATSSPLPGPDPSIDGTVVRRHAPRAPGAIVGVASERDVIVIEVERPEEILEFLDSAGVAGKQIHQGGDGRLTLVISRENLHDEPRVRAELSSRFGDRVRLVDDLGAISVVGAGINRSFEHLRRGSDALRSVHAWPRGIATSSFRITWLIDCARIDDAVRALHRTFLEQPAPLVP